MVTHELTVFPDGRVDGSVSARNGDYKSHTLHFVLAEGLTGASAKLMVWNPGAEKATVYDTAKGDGSCTGQDVTVTPVLWSGPGRARLQLELLNSAGDVVWQSRRFVAAVEDGIPDDAAVPPVIDISDATLTADNAPYGAVFYGAAGRAVGKVPDNRIKPRGWDAVPIEYVRSRIQNYVFQRVDDDRFWAGVSTTVFSSSTMVMVKASENMAGAIITHNDTSYNLSPGGSSLISNVNLKDGDSMQIDWTAEDGTLMSKTIHVSATQASVTASMKISSVAIGGGTAITQMTPAGKYGEAAQYFVQTDAITQAESVQDVVLTVQGLRTCAVYEGALYAKNDGTITIPHVDFHCGFARIVLIDPETGYQMENYLVTALSDAASQTQPLQTRVDPAISYLAGAKDLYDYEANGYLRNVENQESVSTFVAGLNTCQYAAGVWQPKTPKTQAITDKALTLQAIMDAYLTENSLASLGMDSSGNVESLSSVETPTVSLAAGTLGPGSRWLVLVNGRPVTAPGFLANVYVNPNILLELVYTCADGIDVGFPYAGM